MTSPEKEAELPGAQLSFVFGSSVVRAPIPRTPPEDADPQEPAECYSTETLCLSRSQLKHVPDSLLRNSKLKVSVDSKHTPATWCMLQWLSSRKKCFYHCIITNCSLCHLQYLSLEGNQICSIPGSMFISLPNLLWLDLRKNLIESLPPEIGSHRYCYATFFFNNYRPV